MVATLNNFVCVRSQLAEGLLLYLQILKDLPNTERLTYLGTRKLTDVYIPPDMQKQTANDLASPVLWNTEFKLIHQAVILGDSGSGKTLLLRMAASRVAVMSWCALDKQQKGVQDIVIPVYMRLADVAWQGLHGAIELAVGRLLPTESVGIVSRYLNEALLSERCYLFLDALDEVADRATLKERLKPLSNAQGRILITSRNSGYDPTDLPFASIEKYSLATFSAQNQEQFIGMWFGEDDPRRDSLTKFIRNSADLQAMVCTPLLLTLICLNSENHPPQSGAAFRNELYRQVVYDLLQGGWHEASPNEARTRVEALQVLVQGAAWDLLLRNPESITYGYDQFRDAVLETQDNRKIKGEPESVIQQLQRSGLIFSSGKAQTTFIHASFRDYLAAAHVASLKNPEEPIRKLIQENSNGNIHWVSGTEEMRTFLASSQAASHLERVIQSYEKRSAKIPPQPSTEKDSDASTTPVKTRFTKKWKAISVIVILALAIIVGYYWFIRPDQPLGYIEERHETGPIPQPTMSIKKIK